MFGFLHHAALDDGLVRSTARGGVQALALALADAARTAGAEIRTSAAGPLRIAVERGRATGVVLGDGTQVTAAAVVSDRDATTTLTRMVSPRELAPEVNRGLRSLRYRGTTARVHLALDGLPELAGVDREALAGTLLVAPSVAYVERAWDQAKRGAMPAQPVLELTVPTLADPGLAPPGNARARYPACSTCRGRSAITARCSTPRSRRCPRSRRACTTVSSTTTCRVPRISRRGSASSKDSCPVARSGSTRRSGYDRCRDSPATRRRSLTSTSRAAPLTPVVTPGSRGGGWRACCSPGEHHRAA